MTDLEPSAPADSWDAILDGWRRRYPGQRDSVLFCIHKLQQNPDLTLRDFRDEAKLHGIPVAGRSLHSARVLLGLARAPVAHEPEPEAATIEVPDTEPGRRRRGRPAGKPNASSLSSIEDQVVAAVRSIQSAASADVERMRAAMRQAIAILQRALGDD